MSLKTALESVLAEIEAEYDALEAEASNTLAKAETVVEKIEEAVESAVVGAFTVYPQVVSENLFLPPPDDE